MLFFKLALAVIAMAAAVSADTGSLPTEAKKAVAVIYGEIEDDSYGGGYGGGGYGGGYGMPAPVYGGNAYGGAPAPAYGGGYPSNSYGGSGYPAPSPSYGGSYPSKPSYGSSGYRAPSPSYGGSYPSSSYSSGGYSRPLSYSKPGYNSYPSQPSYGAPTYGAPTYGAPTYGAPAPYKGKRIITGTVEFKYDEGRVEATIDLKFTPPLMPSYGGYGSGYGSGKDYRIARSITINDYGVDKDLRGNGYGSGYGSSNAYSYDSYSKSVKEICDDTGNFKYWIDKDAKENYGSITGDKDIKGCVDLEDIIGRSVVIYKDEDEKANKGTPIACGTIALTKEKDVRVRAE